ncbi:MAG TPA: ABC transporter permease [Thermoanaerobaculia bacterium]|nr:ABC transporter permease [Thermoanaerobaculia bacterium]
MLWSTILLAFREIRRNLMRSFLTILGIVIGVSAVITMVTLGNGATQAVANQISSLGSNLLILRPGQRVGPGGGGGARRFDLRDVEAIRTQIGSIKAVAPTVTSAVTVIYGAKNWSTTVTGTTNDDFTAANWHLAAGRIFTDAEVKSGKAACVIGQTVRRELYGSEAPVGTGLRVKGFSCEVVGLLAPKGQSANGQDQDDTVILPLRTVQRRITGKQTVNTILISVNDGVASSEVADRVTALMRERRKITNGKEDDFNVLDTKEIADTLSGTTKTLTLLLGAVAAVSLLVGGIGIMNIMLVSVTERTREIGVRLAIGALEGEVLLQFLIEAIALASGGGLVGIALATLASIVLTKLMSVPYSFNLGINVLSFFFSAAIGVLFGFVPARRAAQLNPITALRHE